MPNIEVGANFYEILKDTAADLYVKSQKDIPPDVRAALKKAIENETNPNAKQMMQIMQKAVDVSDEKDMLVCQDTGIPVYYVTIGTALNVDGAKIREAITLGVQKATKEHHLRSSVVSPIKRENRQNSTGKNVPVIHWDFNADADYLDILMIPKGSGSEQMTFLKMLVPADGVKGIKKFVLDCAVAAGGNPCPPTIVGVGIGGTAEVCVGLAKKAAYRPVGSRNADPEIAALEDELLNAINSLDSGPQGLGGVTTSFDLHIEDAWTHITQNPVAVTFQCWRGERRRAKLWADGRVEIGY
ncbi:MAG: fumarate hydratase [Chloroflexota bacterium]